MALVFTLVQKDCTEPPGDTAKKKINLLINQLIHTLSIPLTDKTLKTALNHRELRNWVLAVLLSAGLAWRC